MTINTVIIEIMKVTIKTRPERYRMNKKGQNIRVHPSLKQSSWTGGASKSRQHLGKEVWRRRFWRSWAIIYVLDCFELPWHGRPVQGWKDTSVLPISLFSIKSAVILAICEYLKLNNTFCTLFFYDYLIFFILF